MSISSKLRVLGMTLNCIHTKWCPSMTLNCIRIFIVTGSFLYWCFLRPAVSVSSYTVVYFYESWSYLIYQRFLAQIAFMCWCAVKQSINRKVIEKSLVSLFIYFYLFDAHFTQLLYITGSETIANMNNDTKASNESTNRHRIAIHYTGYSEDSAVLWT